MTILQIRGRAGNLRTHGEDNIDSSLHFADCLVEKIKIGHFGDVSLNNRRIGADCLHGLVEFLLAAPRDEDIGTFFCVSADS
jgi:hypothetical protein